MATGDDTTETEDAPEEDAAGNESGAAEPALSFGQLLRDCDFTDTAFARRVQERARRARGVELTLARTTVGHWRRGMRPRDPVVADLAAAELSERLGYTVTAGELGWRGRARGYDNLGLTLAEDLAGTVDTLAKLSERDDRARSPLGSGHLAAGAYAGPALYSVTQVVRLAPDAATGAGREAAIVAEAAEAYRSLDARYGSAGIRRQVAALLHGYAVTASSEPAAGRTESAALAELAELAGWLAQDCGHHRAAQRYYIQALGLAEHAGDAAFAGRTLSAMSAQVVELDYRRQGLALARAALRRAGEQAAPAVRAMLHDRHARALAAAGDGGGCAEALAAVEHASAEASSRHPGEAPGWARHYTEADAAWCQGECSLRLGEAAEAAGHLLRARSTQARRRTRACAHIEISLALACLAEGHLDLAAALDASRRALELARGISSARVTSRLRGLDTALSPHQRVAVREWRAAAAAYFRAKR